MNYERIFERLENKVWTEAVELTDPKTEHLIVPRLKLIACCFFDDLSPRFFISIVKTSCTAFVFFGSAPSHQACPY